MQATETEDRGPHPPQFPEVEFEADDEQHQDDTEFGEVHHLLAFRADDSENRGADQRTDDQISEHRPETQPLAQRCGNRRRQQVDEGVEEKLGIHRRASFAMKLVSGN